MRLYAVKDIKAGKFDRPFPMINDQVCMRSFRIMCNNKDTEFGQYPEDYDLYLVGELNEDTGVLTSNVQFIINGLGLVGGNESGNI